MPIGPPIPEIWPFENLTLKIKVKVMGEVKDLGHTINPFFISFLFDVNPPDHSCWSTRQSVSTVLTEWTIIVLDQIHTEYIPFTENNMRK